MAHPCFSCGSECYCSGDIDDVIVSHTPMSCTKCDWCNEVDEDDFLDDEDECYCKMCLLGLDCSDPVDQERYKIFLKGA